jgi:hypothetical protein
VPLYAAKICAAARAGSEIREKNGGKNKPGPGIRSWFCRLQKLSTMKEKAQKLFRLLLETFHEVPGLSLAFLAFAAFSLQMGFDVSVIQVLPYAALNVIFAEFLAYWGVRLGFPYLYEAHRYLLSKSIQELTGLSEAEYKHVLLCVRYYYTVLFTLFVAAVVFLLNLRY